MPIMPMDPANAVIKVRPFFVIRLFRDSAKAVKKDMEVFLPAVPFPALSSAPSKGSESLLTSPSSRRIILVEYCSARSGLWVTIIMSLSFAISFSSSIIWTLVSESSAPVGSSARMMSGSFTRARAMATRCICPPDIWFGFLFSWSPSPTFSRASAARFLRSVLDTPERVRASSTLDSTVW